MELTKNNIVNWINKRVVSYKVSWDDISDYLDMAIDEINSYLSTKYPHVTSILNDYAPEEKTYSFRAGGVDVEFFPGKYFTNIVMPFAITQILTTDEEFTMIYSKYMSMYQENLFIMARDEMNNIPYQFISAPKGVYFSNPDPVFKTDPETYFNQKIVMDIPKLRVTYSWGNYKSLLTYGIQTFVEKPLPMDPNAYEAGFSYMPVMMSGNNYSTYIVDYSQRVLGVFLGWSLKDDNNPEGIVKEPIQLYEDKTFYAVFDLDIVAIEYKGNGGTVHNWRPTYLTKEEFNGSNITPMGGTAFRKGYRFVGFQLESLNNVDDYDGFEEENDTTSEPGAVFSAMWYKMLYNITYIGSKGVFTTNKTNYFFGQEFDLDAPVQTDAEPDEFIGWWDNPQFLGDRITKINESDYGDKTLYAKYNQERYRIRWYKEDGEIIKEEFLMKGSLLSEPTGMTKEDAWIEGLLFSYEYVGFVNEFQQFVQPGITRASRNMDLVVVFSQPIPVETTISIAYKEKNDGVVEEKQIFINKQVGSIIDIEEDILKYLTLEDKMIYEDESSVKKFVDSVSFVIGGNVSTEEMTYGDSFTITEEDPYALSCNYDTVFYTVTFKNKIYENSAYAIGSFETTFEFSSFTTKQIIESKGASYLDIDYQIVVDGGTTEYLQGFKVLGAENAESDMPSNLQNDLTLVPYYGTSINPLFTKTLTLIGFPKQSGLITEGMTVEQINQQLQTVVQNYRIGTNVDLAGIKASTEEDIYKYLKIGTFYSELLNGVPSTAITTLKLNNNRTLYIGTESKKLYSVIYKNYTSGDPVQEKKIDFYPFEFGEENIVFNTAENQPTINSYLGTKYILKGWTETDGGTVNQTTVTLLENRGADLILYPIFVRLGDIIISFDFITNDAIPLLTNYKLDSTYQKVITIDKNNVNFSNHQIFETYSAFLALMNAQSPLITGNLIQPQQIGYNFNRYRFNGGSWDNAMPIIVNVNFDTSELEGEDKEVTLQFELIRNQSYVHLELGETSKPNNLLLTNTYAGTSNLQRSKFIQKGLTFNQLYVNQDIPNLISFEGQPLYYGYWSASNPMEVQDVDYDMTVEDDLKIYIRDTVEGLHQFKIIYRESNGLGGYTTLKTMYIYANQLAQYGSVWNFNINTNKPTDPSKAGYLFKGYSSPSSGGTVATNYAIPTTQATDVYFTAVYSTFGKIIVRFKVKADSGSLLTDYDLTGDLTSFEYDKYNFSKEFLYNQRTNQVFNMTTLLNEFKAAIGLNDRAQMGYEVYKFTVQYHDTALSQGGDYENMTSTPYINLTYVEDSAIDGKDTYITFKFVMKRVASKVFVEVLQNSIPDSLVSHTESEFRRFFMSWGETFGQVRQDFENNYPSNPIPGDIVYDYYTYAIPSGYTLITEAFTVSYTTPQPLQIFIRDDI